MVIWSYGKYDPHPPTITTNHKHHMIYTIAIVLIALWLLGLISGFTMGGFIHVLLVVAVIVLLARIIQGRQL